MASAFNLTAQLNLRGPSNVRQIVSDIRRELGTVTGDINLKVNPQATRNITQLNSAIRTLNDSLVVTRGNATEAANAISAFASAANSINRTGASATRNINNLTSSTQKLAREQTRVSKNIAQSSSEMEEFGRQAALAVRRFAAYSTAAGAVIALTNAIRGGVSAFVDYEKEFVKLQQVTDKTASQLAGLDKEITRLSVGLGVSSDELIKVSSTLAQAGLSARDTQKALQALALTDLAPSFDSLNETVEGSIALMRQFSINAGELEKALGSVNAVAAAFAVESSDLISAIQRTGGVFASASKGVSDGTQALNEFLAVFTSVRQTTRESAETIATGLRTIFTRIQREDTIEALREYGVNLTDMEGKFVGAYKAVQLLSEGLGRIDPRDLKFSQIVEELGGFRQIGKVIPLIQQFGVAQEALGVAQRGSSSLTKDAVTAQLSLSNQIKKVREEFLALIRSVGSGDTFQTLAKGALGFASALIKIADSVKGILPILAIVGAGTAARALSRFGTGFVSGIRRTGDGGEGGGGAPRPSPIFGGGGGSSVPANLYRDLSLLDDVLRNNTRAIDNLRTSLTGVSSSLGTMDQFAMAIQANTSALTSNTASLNALTASQADTVAGLNNVSSSISTINALPDSIRNAVDTLYTTMIDLIVVTRELSNDIKSRPSGGTFNAGGVVKKFARGGVVPGSGNSDTVPAMLMPGEFVIRKKAVETIGADNLHNMNKYGTGGSIRSGRSNRRKKFADGGPAIAEIQSIEEIVDGDTFDAQVVPKSEPYRARFRLLNYDAYETGNRYSKITPDKWNTISKYPSNAGIKDQVKQTRDGSFKIPPSTIVGRGGLTAASAGSKATDDLVAFINKTNKNDLLNKVNNKKNVGFGRIGIDLSEVFTSSYITGRYADDDTDEYASGGKIQKFMAGGKARPKISRTLDIPDAPVGTSDTLKSVIEESKSRGSSYALTVWRDQIKERLSSAYKGVLFPGLKPTEDKITPDTIISMYSENAGNYIKTSIKSLEADLDYIEKATGQKEGLVATKKYSISDMLDSIRAYQAFGLDSLINEYAAKKKLNTKLGSIISDEDKKKYAGLVDKPLSFFAGSLDSSMQFKMPEKLYAGLGASKQKLLLESAAISINDEKDIQKLKGKTVNMPAFLSSSDAEGVASTFSRTGMMTILTNKRRKGLDVNLAKQSTVNRDPKSQREAGNRLVFDDNSGSFGEQFADDMDFESEFIFPRNSKFKVLNARSSIWNKNKDPNEPWTIDWDVQQLAKGGEVFGTGETKFPKRITNAYVKEMEKKLNDERVNNAFDPYPSNERITVDPSQVAEKFQSEPFDRKRFLSLFKTKISRNELIGNLSDFAKFIGLPSEDLTAVLPQTIDFGGQLQTMGYRGTFSRDPLGSQGYDDKGLEAFGFTTADEQDLFGYQKLLAEKEKEIKKILKTPVTTYEDGSFSYDSVAFNKAMDEKLALGKKISTVMDKRAVARKALADQKKGILESTGRGFVAIASNAFERNQPKNVLYHELTHQLFNSLRTRSEDSFTKYKERVSQLFNGDNDDLADAFDALGSSYNSADVVYGRSYKNGLLDYVLQDLRRGTISSGGRSPNPELSKEAYSMWVESDQKKSAREYRPINPKINEILLKGGQRQDTIDKVEDYGKEEFLTTLIQNAPKLDSNMEGILDSTLNELLGNAGIQRQTYATGGKIPLESAGGYSEQELMDAILLYQGMGDPFSKAFAKKEASFISKDETYDTEDIGRRLLAASQYTLPKQLYTGLGQSQYNEMLKDAGLTLDNFDKKDLLNKTIDFPTFLSTSTAISSAKNFIGNPGALMSIDTADSIKGLDILQAKSTPYSMLTADSYEYEKSTNPRNKRLPGLHKINSKRLREFNAEEEVVLPPNIPFKIHKTDADAKKGFLKIGAQMLARGGEVKRNIGVIDTDVLRDPENAEKVKKAMEALGITDTSEYSTKLGEMAAQARKKEELDRFIAIAGAAGSGKSSLAMGMGANDDATLRKTTRFPILTPEDIKKADQVIALTATASQNKLDAFLKDTDRTYVLSSNTKEEQEMVQKGRDTRDITGIGLYGRKPGSTRGASKDFGVEEVTLREELGKKAVVLGRQSGSYRLRRKKEDELAEIVQAKGYYTGGFSPATRGHAGAVESLLSRMMAEDPTSSIHDILINAAGNLPMKSAEGTKHAARYGIFDSDLRLLMAKINFPGAMLAQGNSPTGEIPKYLEVLGEGAKRKYARVKGAMAVTSGKDVGTLGKYDRAGISVRDIPRIDDISATAVRTAMTEGDDQALASMMHPEIASILMGNRAQLRNRSEMVPMLLDSISVVVKAQEETINQQIQQMLASLPGSPKVLSKKVKDEYPDVAEQVQNLRKQRDRLSEGALGYRAYNIIAELASKYPDMYGVDPNRRSQISANIADVPSDVMAEQVRSAIQGSFGVVAPQQVTTGLQEAILQQVTKTTKVDKSSGILPAKGGDILKRFGGDIFPSDPAFGEFAGKSVRDSAVGGKLKYWNTSFPPATKPEKLAYYIAARDYLIAKFNESQGTKQAEALQETTNAVLSSKQLGLVGLNPLGYTGLLGPETWNLGVDSTGQARSVDASIIQRGLPTQYQNVIDYLSGQTEEIVGGASKLLGIMPKKLTKKQRETLGQGNIEGALLEQIFGSADATILDDALRTRPIDFPMGIGPKAAKIFGINPDIPTEVKRTIDSGSRGKAVEEFQRYFRQQYGIPDPEKTAVQAFASGGKVDPLLEKYKSVIASIMPPEYIGKDGFLMTPDGGSYSYNIQSEQKPALMTRLFRSIVPKSSRAIGTGAPNILKILKDNKDKFKASDFSKLTSIVTEYGDQTGRTISLAYGKESDLPHESFHTIQAYLASYYPQTFDKLDQIAQSKKKEFADIYSKSPLSRGVSYKARHIIDSQANAYDSPFSYGMQAFINKNQQFEQIGDQVTSQLGRNELIPQLITMATKYKDSKAMSLLSTIFKEAGLNSDFMSNMPQKFWFGGKVDPLAKKYGISQKEFLEQKKIADAMGLDPSQLEEKLSLYVAKKNRLKEKKFAALDATADASVAGKQVTDQQKALEEFLRTKGMNRGGNVSRFANGGSPEDTVPALLTPGEFVINKKAAERIGYGKLETLNKADKLQGFNKGGTVGGRLRFSAGGRAPGDEEASIQRLMIEFENLAKAIRDTAYAERRRAGISADIAKQQADYLATLAVQTEAISRLAAATTEAERRSIQDATRRVEEDMASRRRPLVPLPPPLPDPAEAARRAREGEENLRIQARLRGMTESGYRTELRKQAIQRGIELRENLPNNIDRLRSRTYQLRDTLTGPAGETKDNAIDEIKTMLREIAGPDVTDNGVSSAVQDLVNNLNNTSLTFSEAINRTQSFSNILNGAGNSGVIFERVIAELSTATNNSSDTLRRMLTPAAIESAISAKRNRQALETFTNRATRAGLLLGATSSIVSKLTQAPESRGSTVSGAGVSGALGGTGEALAFGGQVAANVSQLSQLAGEGGAIGALGGAAQAVVGLISNPIVAGVAIAGAALYGLAAGVKAATNAAREFDKNLANKKLETSLDNVSRLFEDFAKDTRNLRLLKDIDKEINNALNSAIASANIDIQVPQAFWVNLIDVIASGNTREAAERSNILEKRGIIPYLESVFSNQTREFYAGLNAPDIAKQQSAAFKATSDAFIKKSEAELRAGTKFEKILDELKTSSGAPTAAAENIARANPATAEALLRVQSANNLDEAQKRARMNEIILLEAEYRLRLNLNSTLRDLELEKLGNATRKFVNSIERMLSNMDRAINKVTFELDKMTQASELTTASLSGQAKAGNVALDSINILQNRRAYSQERQSFAVNQASEMFGQAGGIVRPLLNVGDRMEDTILSTINRIISENPGINVSDEKISGSIRAALNTELSNIGLPEDLSEKMSKSVQDAFAELRQKQDDNTVSFDQLVEKVPQLSQAIDIAKSAQERAIKALEFWQKSVNDYASAMNQAVDQQIEANARFRKASSIETKGQMDLARALGRTVSLADQLAQNNAETASQTGGPTSARGIENNILALENRRRTQQELSDRAANSGLAGRDELIVMQSRLRLTNTVLRENYDALKGMAENSDMVSASLARLNDIQQKTQAGASLIEKMVTSDPYELDQFNQSLNRLNKNMRGELNIGASSQQRSETLQAFNMIAPFLGEQQNALKANVLESMLQESGVGVGGFASDIINSLRNPEASAEAREATEYYRQALQSQSQANQALGRISELMSANTAEIAAQKLAKAIKDTPLSFESQTLNDIRNGINTLVEIARGTGVTTPPAAKANGGMVYAAGGDHIDFKPRGTDTVPAMLTPGEFVVNKQATSKNLPLLKQINSGMSYYADGGIVVDGIGTNKGKWVSSAYDPAKASKERENTEYETKLRYPKILDTNAAKTFNNMEKIWSAPATFYAGASSPGQYGEQFAFETNNDDKYFKKSTNPLKAIPGIYYNSLSVGLPKRLSRQTKMATGSPANPVQVAETALRSNQTGSVPNLTALDRISSENPELIHINKNDISEYKQAYDNIIKTFRLGNVSNLYKIVSESNNKDLDTMKRDAERFFSANTRLITKRRDKATLENLTVSLGGTNPFLFKKDSFNSYLTSSKENLLGFNQSEGFSGYFAKSIGNALLGSSSIFGLPDVWTNVAAGKEAMSPLIGSMVDSNSINFESASFDDMKMIRLQALRANKLLESYDQAYKQLSIDTLIESKKSLSKKSLVSKLEDLYYNRIFQATFGSELFESINGVKLPLTLYNVDKQTWFRNLSSQSKDQRGKSFSWNDDDFISLSPIAEPGKPAAERILPWVSSDFSDEQIFEKAKQDFEKLKTKPITSTTKIYGTEGSGDLNIVYDEVSAYPFDKTTGQFDYNNLMRYLVIKQASQDQTFNPGSPFGDLLSGDKIYWNGNNIEAVAQYLRDRTPSFDPKTGKKIPAKLGTGYVYPFLPMESGLINRLGPEDFTSINNNLAFRELSPSEKEDLLIKYGADKYNLSSFVLTANGYKNNELRRQQLLRDKKLTEKVVGSNLMAIDKDVGESFTEAKRVTLARELFKILDPMVGIGGAAPTKITDVAAIAKNLSARLAGISRAPGGSKSKEYSQTQAAAAIFSSMYKPDSGIAGYFKRMGIPLSDSDYTSPIPPPADPTKPFRSRIDYYDKFTKNQDQIVGSLKLITQREMDYWRSFASTKTLTDEGRIRATEIAKKFDLAGIVSDTGDIQYQKEKSSEIKTYQGIERIALNPYNIPQIYNDRQNLLDELYDYYKTDKDSNGEPVWPENRWKFIGANTPVIKNPQLLELSDLIEPTNIRDWYAIQDTLINKSKTQSDIQEQIKSLTDDSIKDKYISPQTIDRFSAKAQEWNNYLTGNMYGMLPNYDYILGWLKDQSEPNIAAIPKSSGGIIYASTGKYIDFKPKGTDTVPAMLTPGEFVVNKSATDKHLPLLRAINSGENPIYRAKGSKRGERKGSVGMGTWDRDIAIATWDRDIAQATWDYNPGKGPKINGPTGTVKPTKSAPTAPQKTPTPTMPVPPTVSTKSRLPDTTDTTTAPSNEPSISIESPTRPTAQTRTKNNKTESQTNNINDESSYSIKTQNLANNFAEKISTMKNNEIFLTLRDNMGEAAASGKLTAYDFIADAVQILKDIPSKFFDDKLSRVEVLLLKDLSPETQSSIRSLMMKKEISVDRPYPYQTRGMNNLISNLEQQFGFEAIKPYRNPSRINKLSIEGQSVYDISQGFISSIIDLSDISKKVDQINQNKINDKQQQTAVYASSGRYIDFKPKGTDTIPAMLSPGEFVVNREATQKNLPLLQQMNNGGQVIYRADGSTRPEYYSRAAAYRRYEYAPSSRSLAANRNRDNIALNGIPSQQSLPPNRGRAYANDPRRNYTPSARSIAATRNRDEIALNGIPSQQSLAPNRGSAYTNDPRRQYQPSARSLAAERNRKEIAMNGVPTPSQPTYKRGQASIYIPPQDRKPVSVQTDKSPIAPPKPSESAQAEPIKPVGSIIVTGRSAIPSQSPTVTLTPADVARTQTATTSVFENKNRVWYGGRRWDLNNDGKESEIITGNINKILDNQRVMINTNDVPGKLLILRKEYMNAEDLFAIKAFEDQLRAKTNTSQKLNRTNDQTVLPQRSTDPVIQQSRTGENYLTVSGTTSNTSVSGQPQTLKLDQTDTVSAQQPALIEDILNKSRTWYNGKLWDINNDGKAEELTIGPINRILQDGKILINPRKTWKGQPDANNGLILSSKNLTQDDIDFVNMWKKQKEEKKKVNAMSNGGVVYAQYGYDPYGGKTLSLGRQGFEQRPRTNIASNRPGIFGDGRMPTAAGTTPIVSGTKPRMSTVKPETTPPGIFGTGKAPSGLITTSGTKPIIFSTDETGRVYRQNEIPATKTLSLNPKTERVWYGGKLWDQNRDGRETQDERLIGTLDDIALDGDVRIIRQKDWGYGKVLRLDPRNFAKYSTPEDKAIVQAWLNLGKKKSPAAIEPTRRFANGGIVYADDGMKIVGNSTLTTSGINSIINTNGQLNTNYSIGADQYRPFDIIRGSLASAVDFLKNLEVGKNGQKPFGAAIHLFNAVSDAFVATTRLAGSGLAVPFQILSGSDVLADSMNNEIERAGQGYLTSLLHIGSIIDDAMGYKIFEEALHNSEAAQWKLYEDKLAQAYKESYATGVAVKGLDGLGATASTIASGKLFSTALHATGHALESNSLAAQSSIEAGSAPIVSPRALDLVKTTLDTIHKSDPILGTAPDISTGLNVLGQDVARASPANKNNHNSATHRQNGGLIYAANGQLINFQPKGTDTVPAMLTPGEFVINKKATQNNLSLLKAINNGSYSHGDIVKKFNRGGVVNPGYYQLGGKVDRSNNFDFGSFMQRLMGQLSSVIGTSLREGLQARNNAQNVQQTPNGVSIDSKTLNSIGELTNRLKSIADTLAGLNGIPSEIKITGRHDVNVIINGDSVLNKLNPEIQDIVMNEIKNSFNKLVNANNPVPSNKLINPFDLPQQ